MPRLYRLLMLLASFAGFISQAPAENWPQWRGPTGEGISRETGLPLHWNSMTHIAWQTPLPEYGASTPAIWGNSIFVTTQDGPRLLLLCLEKASGRVRWTREVGTGEVRRQPMRGKKGDERRYQKFHQLHNLASPSPVTDGSLVVVHFGSGDLAAYDFEGKPLWHRNLQQDYGPYSIWWGHANSPVLFEDLVINVCMQDSLSDLGVEPVVSYLVAHDKRTGQRRWLTARPTQATAEQCDSYTTPLVLTRHGKPELVVMGANQLDGYDPRTGQQRWYLPGLTGGRLITGPVDAHDLIIATLGMRGPVIAVKPKGEGKLAPDAIQWQATRGTPDSCCPVVWQDLLFWISDNGVARCVDLATGREYWEQRLPGDYKASPVAAEGRIYFLNHSGTCTVVRASRKFEQLAVNKLEETMMASPAISDGAIYLRGQKAIYCIRDH